MTITEIPDTIHLHECKPLRARLTAVQCRWNSHEAARSARMKLGANGRHLILVESCHGCPGVLGKGHEPEGPEERPDILAALALLTPAQWRVMKIYFSDASMNVMRISNITKRTQPTVRALIRESIARLRRAGMEMPRRGGHGFRPPSPLMRTSR